MRRRSPIDREGKKASHEHEPHGTPLDRVRGRVGTLQKLKRLQRSHTLNAEPTPPQTSKPCSEGLGQSKTKWLRLPPIVGLLFS